MRTFALRIPAAPRHVVLLLAVCSAVLVAGCARTDSSLASETSPAASEISDHTWTTFAETLETLRVGLRVPGLSAGVVRDGVLVWSQGFGFADLEREIPATPETPYGLASVTKPFAAVLLLRMVERGLLDLDSSVAAYGIELDPEGITVRHLLSHTSGGVPGTSYSYDGGRYSLLTAVIEQLYGDSFRRVLRREILTPLGMDASILNCGGCGPAGLLASLPADDPERALVHLYEEAAVPYAYDPDYDPYPAAVPTYANAAAGLISSVTDLAAFARAIEADELLAEDTRRLMFTPTALRSGRSAPYALGWFVEWFGETQLIWHYGYGAYSTLFLMVPSERLTFIVLANSQNLSRPFMLGQAGVSVLASPFALEFYKAFVEAPHRAEPLPVIDWEADAEAVAAELQQVTDPALLDLYEQELWGRRKMYAGVGRAEFSTSLLGAHGIAFPERARTPNELYQVERPGPRPVAADVVTLSSEQAARWAGLFRLQPEDAESGLPPEVTFAVEKNRILAFSTPGECQEFRPYTPFRLQAASNPDLFVVAADGEKMDRVVAEYAGQQVGTYLRVSMGDAGGNEPAQE